ncbi:phytoene/squalene synthase family protein [Porphyromonas circumdentaria]|uniref:Squalene/phytoene synthase n=1 Tax=Porphyromonas circumdentaria TaxID=29524 RepID=A0A1T4PQC5_9PORP|nr:squalene/phytoene synthase family protein [Porphyromonas circumdentaria]MBB6276457.1 phytoene/squalene synthetase [Porphyromonas circumdentaria]MDO4722941.1 squalene/phytoene synthase family protein [Porphyromonas circumdentaria]SJZ93770.1 Squalene/phytoene synthase [Porphyromonas circumdentaria]
MPNSTDKYQLYRSYCLKASRDITKKYSTSFYSATNLFPSHIRQAIHSVYGFVRIADEIVDSFHRYDQEKLLNVFVQDYYAAYESGISINPIIHSFLLTVKQYAIPDEYISWIFSFQITDRFFELPL